jgi:hypothetical protein
MKKTVFFIFILVTLQSISQDDKYLYSGGMLLFQPGYSITQNSYQSIESLSFGIGGELRFYIKNHLTLGIIGGSQKTGYVSSGSENSYITLGYGGPFVGYTYFRNKLRFCASVSVAKGRIKNLHIENQTGVVLNNADYYSYSAWLAYPILSLDYMMTKKIAFTSQLIFLSAVYNENDLYFCPVFQIGVLFNR